MLDTFEAGPQVTGVRNIRRATSNAGMQALTWDSDEATNPKVTYTVQVSADDGASWQTVAVGSPTPEIPLDRSQFPSAQRLKVRVTETNGFQVSDAREQDISLP